MEALQQSSVANFAFPVNVVARVLELENGPTGYLHYGLFAEPEDSISVAQARLSSLIWQQLPPPCRILDVGIGLGTTFAWLVEAGYQTFGITPDRAQLDYAQARYPQLAAALRCSRLEDVSESAGCWDALLFQESGHSVNAVDLFEQADRLLGENGEILLIDEFALRRETPGRDGLHLLDHFLRLAERFGFSVVLQQDLTSGVAPTLDWFLHAIESNADALTTDLGVTAEQFDALRESVRQHQAKFERNVYGYSLLRLRRVKFPRWRVGRIHVHRAEEMRRLFSAVFGHEMSTALWQWKYAEERGCGIGVWRTDGTLIAHYGGVSRDILFFGRREKVLQIGDVMVAVGERGTLSRKGPVFLVAATFLEQELGYGATHMLGVGFPSEVHYLVAERLGLYCTLGRVQEVTWPALSLGQSGSHGCQEIDSSDIASDKSIDSVWQTMARDMGDYMVGVRDAAYVRHRYLRHPEKRYRLFIVDPPFAGLTKRPLGLIVLRETEAGVFELLDVIGALVDIPYLVLQARRVAASFGGNRFFAWLVGNILPVFSLTEETVVRDLSVVIPSNCWTAAPDNALLLGKWWLTGGDTDFH